MLLNMEYYANSYFEKTLKDPNLLKFNFFKSQTSKEDICKTTIT